jgi:hypothetical protein
MSRILIILKKEHKPRTPEEVDLYISATIPNKDTHPLAYETVTSTMVHGPCGTLNPKSPCMKCNRFARKSEGLIAKWLLLGETRVLKRGTWTGTGTTDDD